MIALALEEYDGFYRGMKELFTGLQANYGSFVVYDLHSYNHRRNGPTAAPAEPIDNPQINVGTGTMLSRQRFAPVIQCFIETLSAAYFPTGPLDVRENIKFQGGHFARWLHNTFPQSACVLSIEIKKFFMDEWTGEADSVLTAAVRDALSTSVAPVLSVLSALKNDS
jgi:hypothetical protein